MNALTSNDYRLHQQWLKVIVSTNCVRAVEIIDRVSSLCRNANHFAIWEIIAANVVNNINRSDKPTESPWYTRLILQRRPKCAAGCAQWCRCGKRPCRARRLFTAYAVAVTHAPRSVIAEMLLIAPCNVFGRTESVGCSQRRVMSQSLQYDQRQFWRLLNRLQIQLSRTLR